MNPKMQAALQTQLNLLPDDRSMALAVVFTDTEAGQAFVESTQCSVPQASNVLLAVLPTDALPNFRDRVPPPDVLAATDKQLMVIYGEAGVASFAIKTSAFA